MNREINLIRSLFKCRTDVFAKHWEKGNKHGYMPAYHYDPYSYRLHKMKGGTFKTFNEKTYLPLTDQEIIKHLDGEQLIGIYPLLEDNTSWFIAADFDKENWKEESRIFVDACLDKGIPAYLEKSKSGNGAHVWIFFDQSYPAIRSRKVFISILEESNIFSQFDKNSSFDRLFPNQNFLSGKGLGNLIALPFYKPAVEQGNSCFVDDDLNPYENQWEFLSTIGKVQTSHLDEIFESLNTNISSIKINSNKLHIILNNAVHLNRIGIKPGLISFLTEELNLPNSDYFIKKKTGRNTWNTERYFRLIEEREDEVVIPRGFVGRLIRYCKQEKIDFEFIDQRKKSLPITFNTDVTLRPHQETAVEAASKKEFGVITAPPGSGKTVIGLKIVADKQQPALIIVHRKQLLEQWIERIQAFLGIPKRKLEKLDKAKPKLVKLSQ